MQCDGGGDASDCAAQIRVVKLEEALADKLKCLLQRRYCFDLFDAVYAIFISDDLDVDRSEIVNVFLKKTIFGSSPTAAMKLLLGVPFDLFRGYWGTVVCPSSTRMTFDSAVDSLKIGIAKLFEPFGYGQQFEAAFFPAELRNPILQAGADRKLMRINYHGASRVIEPYALSFKRRKDGGAREYFFAFDRTGGNSGPGIKTFVAPDVRDLVALDESFEPRFDVELSKAGDASSAGYFSTAPRRAATTTRRPTLRTRSFSNKPKYKIQCSYCGKTFTRTKLSTRLNDHKDRFGNKCYGRVGYRVF